MEQFVAWKAMMAANEPTTLWQQFYVLFYQAFIENDRWLQYPNLQSHKLSCFRYTMNHMLVLGKGIEPFTSCL